MGGCDWQVLKQQFLICFYAMVSFDRVCYYIVWLMIHSFLKQACTEMVMPMSYSEQRSMYPPYKFDCASYAEDCIKSYGVRPHVSYCHVQGFQYYDIIEQTSSFDFLPSLFRITIRVFTNQRILSY
jgi:hypothetical protein